MKDEYRIIKWWFVNKRKDSVAIYIPKKYAEAHKMLDYPNVIIYNQPNGVLIKPLEIAGAEEE